MDKSKFTSLKEKQAEIARIKKEMLEESNKIFTEMTKNLFEENPRLKSFGWNQYTPYFNDGDTCYFSVNRDYITLNGQLVDESDWVSETLITSNGIWNRDKRAYEGRTEVPNLKYDEELVKINNEIVELLSQFEDDFFLHQFGDHADITVTADGITIDECEHE